VEEYEDCACVVVWIEAIDLEESCRRLERKIVRTEELDTQQDEA
jgi:hypothetical protein